jgi:hypothetical protein
VLIVTSSSTNAGAMLASELTLTLMLYLTLATLTLTASTTLPTLATLTLAMLALAMFTLTTLPLAMLSLTIRIPYSNNEPRTLVWQVVVTMTDVGLIYDRLNVNRTMSDTAVASSWKRAQKHGTF